MLSSALGALGRRSGGLLRLAPAALPAAPLRLVVPAVAQRFSLARTHRARVRARGPSGRRRRSSLSKYLVPILAAGAVAAVLLPDATGCMGKKKKKDTDEADDMYEVDFIDLRKRWRASTLGAPHHLRGWSVSFPRQASSMAMTKRPRTTPPLSMPYLPVLKLSEVCVELRIVRRHAGQGGEFSLVLVCGR